MFTIKIECPSIVAELAAINATLTKLYKLLRHPAAPTGLRFTLLEEVGMSKLRYRFTADPIKADDGKLRRLTVNGNATGFPANANDFGTVDFDREQEVTASLVDVDTSGNESSPLTVTFTAHDTIAPSAPTGFGVTLESEVADESPATEAAT